MALPPDPTAYTPEDEQRIATYWGQGGAPPAQIEAGVPPAQGPDFGSMSPAERYAAARTAATPTYSGAVLGRSEAATPPDPAAGNPYENMSPGDRYAAARAAATPTTPGAVIGAPAPPTAPSGAGVQAGPTPEDDAQLAQLNAQLAAPAPAPAPMPPPRPLVGQGGGGPRNADPYGVNAATQGYLGSLDARANATQQVGISEGDKSYQLGQAHMELARRQREDSAIADAEAAHANDILGREMQGIQQQLDEVSNRKVDHRRMMKEKPALAFSAVIGGMLGGLYQGLNHLSSNPFLDDLNKQIDRQIALDEHEIDNAKGALKDRLNLLAEQRSIHHDNQQAKQAARLLYYQAAQEDANGLAAQLDTPIYAARAEEAAQNIETEKQKVLLQLAEAKRASALKAASGAFARDKEVIGAYRAIYDKMIGEGYSPAIAEGEAKRQIGVLYAPGSVAPREATPQQTNPLSAVPKEFRAEAAKEFSAHATAEKGIENLKQLFGKWRTTGVDSPRQLDSIKSTISGVYKGALGPGMSSDKDFQTFIEPNIPAMGDSAETLARKQSNIEATIRSKVATPILDQSSPGWKPQPVQRYDAAGRPK